MLVLTFPDYLTKYISIWLNNRYTGSRKTLHWNTGDTENGSNWNKEDTGKGNVQKGVTRSKDHTRTKVVIGTIVQKRYFYKEGTERRYLQ